jgi:L-ribulose-5-phosphate 4-epimerase
MDELKVKVLTVAKAAVAAGLAHETSGNFSAIDRQNDRVVITPSAIPRKDCCADDMCVLNLDGTIREGNNKPSSETPMHTLIYKKMPGVSAVVHTHSPYATAMSAAGLEIGAVGIEILKLNGRVPLVPFAIPGSTELATKAVEYLQKYPVVLLENHGLLATGKDLDQAFLRAVIAEDLAKVWILACAAGGPKLLTNDQLDSIIAFKKALAGKGSDEIVV